jgi:hypothetical protein
MILQDDIDRVLAPDSHLENNPHIGDISITRRMLFECGTPIWGGLIDVIKITEVHGFLTTEAVLNSFIRHTQPRKLSRYTACGHKLTYFCLEGHPPHRRVVGDGLHES